LQGALALLKIGGALLHQTAHVALNFLQLILGQAIVGHLEVSNTALQISLLLTQGINAGTPIRP
jgi:hypothetical protein